MTWLAEANFRLNVNKYKLSQQTIHFLGHQVKYGDMKSNSEKIQALLGTNELTTIKEAFLFVKATVYHP